MLCHKASSNHDYADDDIVVQGYMSHLRQALGVIVESLENYAGAYEALDGMRGLLTFWRVWWCLLTLSSADTAVVGVGDVSLSRVGIKT